MFTPRHFIYNKILFSVSVRQQDIEMPIPKYFVMERAKALKERQKVLEQILAKVGPQDSDLVSVRPVGPNRQ